MTTNDIATKEIAGKTFLVKPLVAISDIVAGHQENGI